MHIFLFLLCFLGALQIHFKIYISLGLERVPNLMTGREVRALTLLLLLFGDTAPS